MQAMDSNNGYIARISKDIEAFNSRVQSAPDGTRLNPVRLEGFPMTDPVSVGKRLNEIAEKARTHGVPEAIGSLYGFTLLVKSETTLKDGFDLVQNRFFVKGEGEILYNYNHGHLAADPMLASTSFINALDTMPALVEKYRAENEKLSKDLPVLKQVVESVWKKEDELKGLKAELTVLEHRIEASLKPDGQGTPLSGDTPESRAVAEVVPVPDGLRAAKDILGERLVIARPVHGTPERRGVRI